MANEYSKFSQRTLILHKLASAYGWGPDTVFKELDYATLKELLDLLSMLENDQKAFISIEEIAGFKNLMRLHGSKKE